MIAVVTAYICWNISCINSLGLHPEANHSVACPREIPLGTNICINGKRYVCDDRTNIKYNGRYDIFFGYYQEAYDEAVKFGRRKLEVKILK